MGDLLSPKRRDVFDRLRRRLDSLRRHQNGTALGRYAQQGSLRGQFEAQHRETLLLHQRWQQSRAAKRNARRDSKAVRDPAAAATAAAANTGPNQPNNLKPQKRKNSECVAGGDNTAAPDITADPTYHNQEAATGSPPAKVPKTQQQQQQQQHQQQQQQQQQRFPQQNQDSGHNTQNSQQPQQQQTPCGPQQPSCAPQQTPCGPQEPQTHRVSVNIVQEIKSDSQQTSEIKLTVSSTVCPGAGSTSVSTDQTQQPHQASASSSISTSTRLKEEPQEDSNSLPSDLDVADFLDDLKSGDADWLLEQALQHTPADEEIPDTKDPLYNPIHQTQQPQQPTQPQQPPQQPQQPPHQPQQPPHQHYPRQPDTPENSKKEVNTGMFAEPLYDSGNTGASAHNYGGVMGVQGVSPVGIYPRAASGPPGADPAGPPPTAAPAILDTGPAAETLQRMAAQHQNKYGMKQSPFESAEYGDRFIGPGQNYPCYGNQGYGTMPCQPGSYTGYNPAAMNAMGSPNDRMPQMPQNAGGVKTDYGATKRLSHYPEPPTGGPAGPTGGAHTPSSLEQLHKQVQSHFSQPQGSQPSTSPHMHITQSQQLEMSHAAGRMQVSQTQRMQIQGGQPGQDISIAQQQSFNMSQQQQAQQQQAQQQQAQQQQQQAQQQAQQQPAQQPQNMPGPGSARARSGYIDPSQQQMYQQQQQGKMNAFMNRPPPEYKIAAGNREAGVQQYPSNNPLQTMQNMVNQTSQSAMQNGMYVKTEMLPQQAPQQSQSQQPPGTPAGTPAHSAGTPAHSQQVQAGQSAVQTSHSMQQVPHAGSTNSSPLPTPHTGMPTSSQPTGATSAAPTYPQAQGQTQGPAQGQGQPTPQSRPNKSTPTYTSAIMRGQRPPNVNVGPNGLNISHPPRGHPQEWARGMMAGTGMAPGMMAQVPPHMVPQPGGQRHQMTPMMQYHAGYNGQAMQGMPRMAMQQAQQQQQQAGMQTPSQQHQAQQAQAQQEALHRQHMMNGARGARPGIMPHAMMMSQQQHIQMQQQNGHMTNMAMAQAQTAAVATGNVSGQHGHAHPGYGGTAAPTSGTSANQPGDFSLDFLDNAQTNNQDFFDSMVQNANPSDFNFIDDILGGSK